VRIILSIVISAVILTATGGWRAISVCATAPGELVKILERAK
jgi:hypothetical protein